jgi:flagellar motor switch protein FliN/FliY
MVDEFLNQAEIDALLSDDDESSGGASTLTPEDMSIMNEVAGIVASASSNVIGMLAGRTVSANLAEQVEIPQGELVATVEGGGSSRTR